MFGGLKLRLVDDWHRSWRWSSMRFLAVGAAAQAALYAPQRVLDYAPSWFPQALAVISMASIFLAAAGRITTTEKPDVHN